MYGLAVLQFHSSADLGVIRILSFKNYAEKIFNNT